MYDNSKGSAYAVVAKDDRHHRTDGFSCQNQNAGEIPMDAYREWVKKLESDML